MLTAAKRRLLADARSKCHAGRLASGTKAAEVRLMVVDRTSVSASASSSLLFERWKVRLKSRARPPSSRVHCASRVGFSCGAGAGCWRAARRAGDGGGHTARPGSPEHQLVIEKVNGEVPGRSYVHPTVAWTAPILDGPAAGQRRVPSRRRRTGGTQRGVKRVVMFEGGESFNEITVSAQQHKHSIK